MSVEQEDRILIKKYGNRRLYSTASSSYITLVELEELVRNGESIQVVDASTKEDITSQILTQILVESGKAKSIPVNFLERMIRHRADLLGALLNAQTQQIERSVDVARHAQDEFIRMMQRAMQVGGGLWNPFMSPPQDSSFRESQSERRVADLEREIQDLKEMMRQQNDERTK